ncbi:MAG: serine/threonine-protein kinase [Nostocaceae cyanobacterium]|nr:serine/threonine-protein kinase [Nostocaceae cyanobacterium]
MTHHLIGKVLQNRYQVIKSLGAGVFGQTYIAVDIQQPHYPKCVIKQLKIACYQSSYLETVRLRFLSETQTLQHLGHHNQIPQLISCFEEYERFYLVQEFIEGHSLTAELPTNQNNMGDLWTETEVIEFLRDVLSILDFIHSHGVIHCDVKPDNLIRRAYDGKLVLIDFGCIQPVNFGVDAVLPIYRMPVTSLGYIPPEQFIDQTQPNSDIYALGMIAIQTLTGLTPLQLNIDPHSNEIIWRFQHTIVSDFLAAVLSKMIRYNFQERFQSAAEVLRVLKQMPLEGRYSSSLESQSILLSKSEDNSQSQEQVPTKSKSSNSQTTFSPLLTGMKVGLVTNSMLMGFGVYSLLQNSPNQSPTETLRQAAEKYQGGDLHRAIALIKSIPSSSNVYPDAQATIEEWQQQWQIAAEIYQKAESALKVGEWSQVLQTASMMPDILYWQSKTDKLVERSKFYIEEQTNHLLAKAYNKAAEKDFSGALTYLRQIPPESAAGAVVQKKLSEYKQKQKIRAVYLLQQAYNKAASTDFDAALKFLKQVPKDTPVYATAKAKMAEYSRKQRIQAAVQKEYKSTQVRNSQWRKSNFQQLHLHNNSPMSFPRVNFQ